MTERKIFITLVVALLLSLSANVFFGGVYFSGWHGGSPYKSGYRSMDESLKKSLSENDREILKKDMEVNRPRFRQLRDELQAAREKVEQAMRAEPLDQQALDAAMAEQEKAEEAMRSLVREVRKNTAAKLSPEGRSAFARHMRERDESRFRGPDSRRPSGFDRERRSQEAPAPQNAP